MKRRERALRFAECPGRALPPCEGFTPVLSLNPGACATWQLCSAAAWLSRGMVYSLAAGRCGRGVVGLTLESVLFLCPMQPGRDAGQRPLHQSPPSLCLFHCCVQDSVIRKRITQFPLSQIHSLSLQTRSLTNTFSLGKSPKERIILTTVKSVSMTTPETCKNQLPSKVRSLTKGQRLH